MGSHSSEGNHTVIAGSLDVTLCLCPSNFSRVKLTVIFRYVASRKCALTPIRNAQIYSSHLILKHATSVGTPRSSKTVWRPFGSPCECMGCGSHHPSLVTRCFPQGLTFFLHTCKHIIRATAVVKHASSLLLWDASLSQFSLHSSSDS